MKRITVLLVSVIVLVALAGCIATEQYEITATTLPVYELTQMLCENTGIQVGRLISENVSCLHDYTLQVQQMRMLEGSKLIVISGAGFEDFLHDAISSSHTVIDASQNIELYETHAHHDSEHHHTHETDPHIWLSPANARQMAKNICNGLINCYPESEVQFRKNLTGIEQEIDQLERYATERLSNLDKRQIITFHDGFSYMADYFDIEILHAIEEESGSEASAAELIELLNLVDEFQLSSIFIERNGSVSAARIIAAEKDCTVYELDMALSGTSYFEAMYHNINTLKEALG